jgi:hypothetical protein
MKHFIKAILFIILIQSISYAQTTHKGTVLETLQVENYTYVRINENNKDIWIAIPKLDVKPGNTIETSAGIIMKDFNSPTLKRTFTEIIFATKASVLDSKEQSKNTTTSKVPGIFNVSKIIKNASDLKGNIITFNGKVTKVTPKIMGKNWVHFSDINGNTDLVVTTQEELKVGDIVTMEGKVETNKNLGAGYFFYVIIEEAKIVEK